MKRFNPLEKQIRDEMLLYWKRPKGNSIRSMAKWMQEHPYETAYTDNRGVTYQYFDEASIFKIVKLTPPFVGFYYLPLVNTLGVLPDGKFVGTYRLIGGNTP